MPISKNGTVYYSCDCGRCHQCRVEAVPHEDGCMCGRCVERRAYLIARGQERAKMDEYCAQTAADMRLRFPSMFKRS